MKKVFLLSLIPIFLPKVSLAHCPLCTAGAGALAILAASLGVSSIVVGILIGAFAFALSLWLSPMIKRKYIPLQNEILAILIFFGTIVPIMPLIRDYGPLSIFWRGEYGSLFNNTYVVNLFIVGTLIGMVIMAISPYISRVLSKIRGRHIPFQGIIITLLLLLITSLIVQFA